MSEWIAFAQTEPFGDMRGDMQAAIVASTVANVQRQRKKAYKVTDFMPVFERKEQSPEEMRTVFESMFRLRPPGGPPPPEQPAPPAPPVEK
jgi:hypothetical protein